MELDHSEDRVCRTCLSEQNDLMNINRRVATIIHELTQAQINNQDGLSQWVCSNCMDEINRFSEFRAMCLDSFKFLKERLTKCMLDIKKEEPNEENKLQVDVKFEPSDSKDDNLFDDDDDDDDKFILDISFKSDASKISKNNDDDSEESGKIIFPCPYCRAPFIHMKAFDNHMDSIHSDKKNIDVKALIESSTPLGYVSKNAETAKDEYRCSCDNFASPEYSAILEHFKTHYGDKPIVCTLCEYRCANMGLLKKHTLVHSSEKPFRCSVCDYTCKNKGALKTHSAVHSSKKNYECKLCSLSFKQAPSLSLHKAKVHDNRRNHECQICKKKFLKLGYLKQHMSVHTGERPHICHLCGQAFSQASSLRTHITAMHESDDVAKRFKCDICGFTSKHNLYRHMIRHSGVKDYKCDQCPFLTNSAETLKNHMLRHAGETRFSCDLCDYKCLERGRLKAHQVIHTGERNYACDLCSYAGSNRAALKRHKETHSTELKYSCPNCPYKTNVREILNKHLRKKCQIRNKD